MRTFLCALCVLLIMLSFILIYNHRFTKHITELSHAVSALPEPSEVDCSGAIARLEAQWQHLRPHIGMAVNRSTLEEIDRLIASLRVTASFGKEISAMAGWEHYRSLLILQLAELKKQMGCDIRQIV